MCKLGKLVAGCVVLGGMAGSITPTMAQEITADKSVVIGGDGEINGGLTVNNYAVPEQNLSPAEKAALQREIEAFEKQWEEGKRWLEGHRQSMEIRQQEHQRRFEAAEREINQSRREMKKKMKERGWD